MTAKSSVVCGRCGQMVEVKSLPAEAELLAHAKTCKGRVDRDSSSRAQEEDRTLTVRSGIKDRRGRQVHKGKTTK